MAMTREEASKLIDSLFESWYASLVRYAFRGTQFLDLALAEDMVQESFMALYRDLCQGKKIDHPKAWTLCVVRREIGKNERDRRKACTQTQSLTGLDALPDSDRGVNHAATELDDLLRLCSILTRREEEVVHLRLHGHKYREIATHLGISPNSVNTLLARAIRKLRKAARTRFSGQQVSIHAEQDIPKTLQ